MSISRRNVLYAGARAALAASLAGTSLGVASASQKIRLTVTSGHPINLNWITQLDKVFLPELSNEMAQSPIDVEIDWNKAYGGTVAKIGAESDALRTGVSDFGIVGTVFEAGKFPLQQVSLQLPFTTSDMFVMNKVVSHVMDSVPEMQEAWKRNRIRLLTAFVVDGYHLMTNFPVKSVEDLRGKKILAPGAMAAWLQGTGAIAVNSNLNSYYNDLQTGLADGVIPSLTPAWAIKLHEVAPYITLTNFGAQWTGGLGANEATLKRLPKGALDAALRAAKKYEIAFTQTQTDLATAALDNMIKAGAKVSEFPESERRRWADALPDLPKQWAGELESKGLPATKVVNAFVEGLHKNGITLPRNWSL